MTSLDFGELVDRVTARTHGTRGDPLSRGEVEQVVEATFAELARVPELADALPDFNAPGEGSPGGMSETTPQTPRPDEAEQPEQPQPAQPEQPQPPEADPTAPEPDVDDDDEQ